MQPTLRPFKFKEAAIGFTLNLLVLAMMLYLAARYPAWKAYIHAMAAVLVIAGIVVALYRSSSPSMKS